MADFVAGDMVIIAATDDRPPLFGILVAFVNLDSAFVDVVNGPKNCWCMMTDLILHPHSRIHHMVSGTRYLRSIGRG